MDPNITNVNVNANSTAIAGRGRRRSGWSGLGTMAVLVLVLIYNEPTRWIGVGVLAAVIGISVLVITSRPKIGQSSNAGATPPGVCPHCGALESGHVDARGNVIDVRTYHNLP